MVNGPNRTPYRTLLKAVENTPNPLTSPTPAMEEVHIYLPGTLPKDGRMLQGRKKVRRDHAKCYREMFKLRVKLDREKRMKNKYKQRYYRSMKKPASTTKSKEENKRNVGQNVYFLIVNGIKRYKNTAH